MVLQIGHSIERLTLKLLHFHEFYRDEEGKDITDFAVFDEFNDKINTKLKITKRKGGRKTSLTCQAVLVFN